MPTCEAKVTSYCETYFLMSEFIAIIVFGRSRMSGDIHVRFCSSKIYGNICLTISSVKEKIIQKAMFLVFEAIWEPSFLGSSSNFWSGCLNRKVLYSMKSAFRCVSWIIKIDLINWFDVIDPQILVFLIRRKVSCKKTIRLFQKLLQEGCIPLSKIACSSHGLYKDSVLGSLLCNILFHELDVYVGNLKASFKAEKFHIIYPGCTVKIYKTDFIPKGVSKNRKLKCGIWRSSKRYDVVRPKNSRIVYSRFADDFVIGVLGRIYDAKRIKSQILTFFRVHLFLSLGEQKLKLATPGKSQFFFLGCLLKMHEVKFFACSVSPLFKKTLKLCLYVPLQQLFIKLKEKGFFLLVNGLFKPRSMRVFANLDRKDILLVYSSIIKGIHLYYSFVDNQKNFKRLIYGIKTSCALTLAFKFKLYRRSKIYNLLGFTFTYRQNDKFSSLLSVWHKKLLTGKPIKSLFFCRALRPKAQYNHKFFRFIAIYRFGFIRFWSIQTVMFSNK